MERQPNAARQRHRPPRLHQPRQEAPQIDVLGLTLSRAGPWPDPRRLTNAGQIVEGERRPLELQIERPCRRRRKTVAALPEREP
jgi:hypothetical protein